MASPSYNNPSKRLHPPPAPSAFFASSQAARLAGSSSPSPPSTSSSSSSSSSQKVTSNNLQYLVPRPVNERKTSVSSTSSTSSTSSSSGISAPSTPRTFSPASLSNQQAVVDSYRNRYASYLAATWGISPAAAGAEFEHHLHTRPGQHWPQPDRH